MDRLRVGVLAPENVALPAPAGSGGLTGNVAELVARLAKRCDVVVGIGGDAHAEAVADGVRYIRASTVGDRRRRAAVELVNVAQRRLHLPDPPYAGRAAYFDGYARAHAATFRGAGVQAVLVYNVAQWLPALRAALPSARIALYMHSEWLAEMPYGATLERLRSADVVLGVSQQVADQVRARFPELASRVGVVGNGVDTSVFRPVRDPAARERLGVEGSPVVLFVGRLSAEKGVHTLIEAMPHVLERAPRATLLLVGSPIGLRSPLPTRRRPELAGHPQWRARYAEHLRELAEPLGPHVRFVGTLEREDLPAAYSLADVYVQPSVFESFGLPVVEAMACGVPVVATIAGALPELVEDHRTGLLVPARDPRALADAILGIAADPELAHRLGRAGRERAQGLTWDAAGDRLYDALRPDRTEVEAVEDRRVLASA